MSTKLINYTDRITISELGGGVVNESVRYGEQELTEEQKAQARANIGVASAATAIYLGDIVGRV